MSEVDQATLPDAPEPHPQGERPLPGWRQLWQVPALVGSVALLGGALMVAVLHRPEPPVDAMLRTAGRMVERHEYQDALKYLNEKLLPFATAKKLRPEQEAAFKLTLARALYLGQQNLGISRTENHERILATLKQAEEAGATLAPSDLFARADTLLSLGRTQEALEIGRRLPEGQHSRRLELLKRAVDRELASRRGDRELALRLISEYLAQPGLDADQRIWALDRQARALIDQGYAEDAIAKILREVQRFESVQAAELAPIYGLLSEAYLETGAIESALRQISRAEEVMPPTAPGAARIALLRAWIEQARGDTAAARTRFSVIVEEMSGGDELLPALLGLAEAEALLGNIRPSLEAYRRLTSELKSGRRHPGVDAENVGQSLLSRSRQCAEQGDLDNALEYASIADQLYAGAERPEQILLTMSIAHRSLADRMREHGRRTDAGQSVGLEDLDPATREEARRHLVAAASYARRHATSVAVSDNEAYGRSIWLAADSYDLAGDLEEAIANFQEFLSSFPDDARRAEARFRLGQAFRARGEYGVAADFYRGLIEDRNDRSAKGAGPWGDASYVPLAQSYILDADPTNDIEAERLLLAVVDGRIVVDPATRAFRDGLVELGAYYYRTGAYPRAIERLREALTRFPDDPETHMIRYRLADSLRLGGGELGDLLAGSLPESQRSTLEAERHSRLTESLQVYTLVIEGLEAKDDRRRTRLERESLRNAYFFRGACAFDLGDHAAAIRFYDAAYDRYPKDPASLAALVQIVNAYVEQGDFERARASNSRARRFFHSLPDEVWDDPHLPMSRTDWERWLESSSRLYAQGGSRD
ncbi:MAG: tetratricopeptide repeat protein [Phycisphaeraceae bacterium]|nr:tetratricopeptide repeat protein [Phycisphaeraceae bacterium]MCW5754073.1 tetratricopeptide repeat protein [Phycisphaeraceae bacterium]